MFLDVLNRISTSGWGKIFLKGAYSRIDDLAATSKIAKNNPSFGCVRHVFQTKDLVFCFLFPSLSLRFLLPGYLVGVVYWLRVVLSKVKRFVTLL